MRPWNPTIEGVRNPSPNGVRYWTWGRIRVPPFPPRPGMKPRAMTRKQPLSYRNRRAIPSSRRSRRRIRPRSSWTPPPDPETGSESPAVPHHPIATGPREPRAKRAGWLRTHWLSALSLAVVAGILALLVWLWLGNGPPPPPPPGPALTPEQRIYAVLKGFDCIPWQVEKFAEDRYAIRGSVTSPDELQRLDAELGKIPATTHTGDVSIVPRPLCPLLGLADRYATEPRLAIRPNHPDGRYTTGDEFGVVFHNREHSSGRLYAFYINSAGKVYVPGPLLYVGTEARLEDYKATAPGKDLILALWCRGVMLPQHLGELTHVRDFLPVFEEILNEHAPHCSTSRHFIEIY